MYTGYIKYYFASFSTFERNFASFFVFTSKFLAFLNPSTELSFFFTYNPRPKLRFIVTMPPISITRGPTNLWLGFSIKKKKKNWSILGPNPGCIQKGFCRGPLSSSPNFLHCWNSITACQRKYMYTYTCET